MSNAQPEMQIVLRQSAFVLEHLKTTVRTSESTVAVLAHSFCAVLAAHFSECADEIALLDYLTKFKSTTLDAYFLVEKNRR